MSLVQVMGQEGPRLVLVVPGDVGRRGGSPCQSRALPGCHRGEGGDTAAVPCGSSLCKAQPASMF